LERAHHELIEESSEAQKKHFDEICQFETILDERNREIRDLKLSGSKMAADSEQQIESLRKLAADLKEKLTARSEKCRRNLALVEQRKRNLEQQLLNKLKAKERQNLEESNRAAAIQDDLRAKLDEQGQSMKLQLQEQRELSEKLSDALAESERRNRQMVTEMSKLAMAKKALEVQLKAATDQMKRELQILTSQAALKAMNAETSFQEDLNALKSRCMREKSELIATVLAQFDELEQFEDEDITDAAFLHIMEQIAQSHRDRKASGGSKRSTL
jgi:hypothetical protein